MQVETGRLRVVVPEAPERTPETPKPDLCDEEGPSPGRYIREQRQRRGMSIEQLAAATKIPRSSLALLEEDRYDELPGPVFVKGFLRCCARSLGVNPETVMELFYERERAVLNARRRERPATSVPHSGAPSSDGVVKRLPPRVRKHPTPAEERTGPWPALMDRLPSPSVVLWVAVVVFVAMVVLAAFNLVNGTSPLPQA